MRAVQPVGRCLGVAVGVAVLTLGVRPASANINTGTLSFSGSACSNPSGNDVDGFTGCANNTITNNGTTLAVRFGLNVNADTGVASTRDQSSGATHRISFSATAPGGYRLDVNTSLIGALNRSSDVSGCDGQADISGVSGSVTAGPGLSSGSINIADPGAIGNGGGDSNLPFSPSSGPVGQIFAVADGGNVSHTLNFTFSASARSNSCEAAVRVGIDSTSTTGCAVCEYPGDPSRTAANDGHFVTVTFNNLCGNSSVDSSVGEDCDQGVANGTAGSCCDSNCQFKTNGTACTDDGNECTNDQCNGASVTCQHPNKTNGTACTADSNVCTNDVCTTGVCTHPNNTASCTDSLFCNGTDTCSGGTCSVHTGNPCVGPDGDNNCAESCNEAADNCTAPDPNGSACNDGTFCNGADTCSSGVCSGHAGNPCAGHNTGPACNDSCNEAADNCTAPDTGGTSCSDGAFCTATDTCNGSGTCVGTGNPCAGHNTGPACNDSCNESADNCTAPDTGGTLCSDSLFCTQTDTCNGSGTCIGVGNPCVGPDGDANCSESCNEAADNCTAPDPNGSACTDGLFCNGTDSCTGGSCSTHTGDPCTAGSECADACNESADNCFDLFGTGCTSDGNPCSLDQCNGTGTCAHPAGNAGALCRAGSGDSCDPNETCSGASTTCAADVVASAGTLCRGGSGDLCDPDENCTGVATEPCPADVVSPGGTECRSAAGDCDVAENCTGVAGEACPADSVSGAFVVCRSSGGDCDITENCDGVNPACPADAKIPNGTTCRSAGGDCDVLEACDGVTDACPVDGKVSGGTECRASGGPCDPAEACDGSTNPCPPDAKEPSGTVCRSAVGDCDLQEVCNGSSDLCPSDAKKPNGTSCRSSAGICDVVETCNGTSNTCPADAVAPTSSVCRPASSDPCDVAEHCDGSTVNCPADTGLPDGDGDAVCDAQDDCPLIPDPGQVDSDNDNLGDVCDPCNNVFNGGTFATKAKIIVTKLFSGPGDDKVKMKGFLVLPQTPTIRCDLNGLRILLQKQDGSFVFDTTLPPGAYDVVNKVGWKSNSTQTKFVYKNSGTAVALINGINKASVGLSSRTPGLVKFSVGGKNGAYGPLVQADMALRGTIILDVPPHSATQQCGETNFATGNCLVLSAGNTVKCQIK